MTTSRHRQDPEISAAARRPSSSRHEVVGASATKVAVTAASTRPSRRRWCSSLTTVSIYYGDFRAVAGVNMPIHPQRSPR